MARYQIIDTETGHKLNIVEWDGKAEIELPEGQRIEPDDGAPVWSEATVDAVPLSVTNFQARAVMRQVPMPNGRSLFTTVDTDLRTAVTEASELGEFEPARIQADLNWQAWEQANEYERYGAITKLLAARYDFDDATTDDLFRKAKGVSA